MELENKDLKNEIFKVRDRYLNSTDIVQNLSRSSEKAGMFSKYIKDQNTALKSENIKLLNINKELKFEVAA